MAINYFRLVARDNHFETFQCLKCREQFPSFAIGRHNFCHHCGTAWDGAMIDSPRQRIMKRYQEMRNQFSIGYWWELRYRFNEGHGGRVKKYVKWHVEKVFDGRMPVREVLKQFRIERTWQKEIAKSLPWLVLEIEVRIIHELTPGTYVIKPYHNGAWPPVY